MPTGFLVSTGLHRTVSELPVRGYLCFEAPARTFLAILGQKNGKPSSCLIQGHQPETKP